MKFSKNTYRYLLPVLFVVFFTTSVLFAETNVRAGDFKVIFTEEKFSFDSLFKIDTADFLSTGSDQIVFLGRDYLENKATISVFSWADKGLGKIWESDNLLEEKSPIFMTIGRPYAPGEEAILVFTNHRLYIFTYREGHFVLTSQIYHTLLPQEINVVDINGDGIDELLVVRVGEITKTYLDKVVDLYRLEGEELIKLGVGPLMGNIRAITGCDLNGDGRGEILVESGLGNQKGRFTLLRWTEEEELREEFLVEGLIDAVTYGLDAGLLKRNGQKNEDVLITADDWGRVNIFTYYNGRFRPYIKEIILKGALISVAIGDFNGDGVSDLAVGGYPTRLFLLMNLELESGRR